MAAKLKKRAMAEYESQSQTQVEDVVALEDLKRAKTAAAAAAAAAASVPPQKKLRLVLQQSRSAAGAAAAAAKNTDRVDPFPIDRAASGSDITLLVVKFLPKMKSMENSAVAEAVKRLLEVFLSSQSQGIEDVVRVQLMLTLGAVLSHKEKCDAARLEVKEKLDELVEAAGLEASSKVEAVLITFLSRLHEYGVVPAGGGSQQLNKKLFELASGKLKTRRNSQVRIASVHLFGAVSCGGVEKDLGAKVLAALGKLIQSPEEPRIRHAAYEGLLSLHNSPGGSLNSSLYHVLCRSLNDDYDGVRRVALKLLKVMALAYPEEKIRVGQGKEIRLADDAFGKICNGINDLCVQVRELSADLMGTMGGVVSQEFLEQTLDKKLMSNMRLKKSAHEREAKLVASGEWSSGKKWADDAPKEELDADTVNLMAMGACGAFIHGLEDEFLSVRRISVDSLTKLAISNQRLATLALDFLVDMFNDEIEQVRLRAIESLTTIAGHICLQVHQLETILSALDDFSVVVREKLHIMLQASTIATKDGLQGVIAKLLENLKKYPQDKRSILITFKKLGANHPDLTLPLVTQLLEVHPFFDTAEPDIEDPGHLCILVLVFNAAQHCPTMEPLLDQHTRKHRHFLLDTYPHLMPDRDEGDDGARKKKANRTNTVKFYERTLTRVSDSEHLSMASRIGLLERAGADLARLGSIEPSMADQAAFASMYLQCQTLLLKCLATRFWCNPQSMAAQETAIIEANLANLSRLCLQLSHRFSALSVPQRRKVHLLKIHVLALRLVFLVRASNKSALSATDRFLNEVADYAAIYEEEGESSSNASASPFFLALLKRLTEADDHKPGAVVRLVQPLLLLHPLASLQPEDGSSVALRQAIIYEPTGMNETPLKYTAGMVLAVSVDAEISNVQDCLDMVRIAIKTPDQKVQLVTPKPSHFFCPRAGSAHRLLTEAYMSHQVWSEAMHVEIGLVLDLSAAATTTGQSSTSSASGRNAGASSGGNKDPAEKNVVYLCEPVKVNVLPKAVKRGI